MKNLIKFMFIFLALGAMVVSCGDDDDNNPVIKIAGFEFGSGHGADATNHQGVAGRDIHLEASIFAKNKVEKIVVTIHPEGEDHDHEAEGHDHEGEDHDEWEVEKTYTNYKGELNATFHEHIDIPEEAEAGHYHLHFKVVDMSGNTESVEKELEVIKKQ